MAHAAASDRYVRVYQFRHEMACHIAMHLPTESMTMATITAWSVSVEWALWQKSRSLHHYVLHVRKHLRQIHTTAHVPVSPRRLRELSKPLLDVIPETTSVQDVQPLAVDAYPSVAATHDKLNLAHLQHRYIKTKYGSTIGRAAAFLQPLSLHNATAAHILDKLEKIAAFLDRTDVELPTTGLEQLEQKIQGQILPLYERLQTVCT
ncbi:Aste57867_14655 [Aphanomyces stellatus]|uniref:Aste57867_14655 protein n=1 Tax=Aphanomyces stellatus TaxID=120398 RepID=A0A485L2Y4_9STRA|nr:hypothetical protein As57867_014600 [Aphanomyces stellatus]VFT91474.1 Aste57867_14655 [Aphanomyces stellatus]